MNEYSIGFNMQIIILVQPGMPVDTGTFVEPSFILCGIHPDHQNIVPVKIDIISNIISNTEVTALVVAEIKTIDPNMCIPEYAVELDLEALPGILTRNE